MNIVCLDMEGVLVPEIWIAFAEESGIPELRRTTRDEPDYDKLMRWRIDLLRQRGLKLSAIQETISRIDPLPGAKNFLDALRKDTQVVILSDTFDQFAMPLMAKLGSCAVNTPSSPPSRPFSPSATTPSPAATAITIWR